MELMAGPWEWNGPRLILSILGFLFGGGALVKGPKWFSRWRRRRRMAGKREEAERWARTVTCWNSWFNFFCGYVANHARHFRFRSQGQDGYVLSRR